MADKVILRNKGGRMEEMTMKSWKMNKDAVQKIFFFFKSAEGVQERREIDEIKV